MPAEFNCALSRIPGSLHTFLTVPHSQILMYVYVIYVCIFYIFIYIYIIFIYIIYKILYNMHTFQGPLHQFLMTILLCVLTSAAIALSVNGTACTP